MNAVAAIGLLFLLSVVDPIFPPNAVLGGTVVARLHFVSGNVKNVTILSGEEPFSSSCKTALAEWHMKSEPDGDELVIVHFRQPYLYTWGDNKEEINPARPGKSLPYPIYIVPPSYPANALGQGSVILRTEVSAEGKVSDVQVIEPMGVLTSASTDAVRRWRFTPAEDEQGAATSSHAYAVLVYRYPLTKP